MLGVQPLEGDQTQLILHYAGETIAGSAKESSNSRMGMPLRPALPKVTPPSRCWPPDKAPATTAKSGPAARAVAAKAAARDGAVEAQLAAAAEAVLQEFAKDFPACDGMLVSDIAQQPAIVRLQLSLVDLRDGLKNLPHQFQVFRSEGGSTPAGLYVRLRPHLQHETASVAHATDEGTTFAANKESGTRLTMEQWEAEQVKRFAGLPPLPEGWLRALSRSTGRIYYVNSATGESQFEEPVATGVSPPTRWEAPPPAAAACRREQAAAFAGFHSQQAEEPAGGDSESPPAQWDVGGEGHKADGDRSPTPSL